MLDKAVPSALADGGIDRKQLRLALKRFNAINEARLERVRGMLNERHRMFVDLLPLLFHANHPTLPGYVSHHTPCGISGYSPNNTTLELAKRLSRSFNWQRPAVAEAGVHSVYMMGSSGTIGHSDSSDIDIWVCYPEELDRESLTQLQKKATLLQLWARGLELEAHIFLMNGEKFVRGQREPLTGENCGTAQHYLLMDEFYRTGVLLAGRIPAWWLVPPAAESNYSGFATLLTHKRYMGNIEQVDFGGIDYVPAGEFVGAGIWQLYKAIASPYKSVLKLLLFEVYAAHFPQPVCLSSDYKRAVYAGIVDIDELDPYVMIYRRLENHLLFRDEPGRLEIVRRCLYYKAAKKLSRPPQHGVKSWQRKLMERLINEWGWDRAKLAMLDSRTEWNIREVAAERNELVRELNYSYRFLSEFARHSEVEALIDAREFSILGRRLLAAHERKAGKIEMLNPGRLINVAESELSICALAETNEPDAQLRWSAYAELISARGQPTTDPLMQSACLTELVAWCVLNGVIGEHTRIVVREELDGLRPAEVEGMVREIRDHIITAAESGALQDEAFMEAARPIAMLVFVNVATDPLADTHRLGLHRVSSQTDSLGYSALRENLVHNIETLACNSWGEIIATRYVQEAGLIRCVRDYLQLSPGGEKVIPATRFRCFCASRADAIASRIEQLFDDLERNFFRASGDLNTRYVFGIENSLHLIQLRQGLADAHVAAGLAELYIRLAEPQPAWSQLALDRYALRDTPLPAIIEHVAPLTLGVFCELRRDTLLVTVVDEHGSWFHAEHAAANEASVLAAIDQFLSSVRYRQNSATTRPPMPRYFRLQRDSGRRNYRVSRMPLPDEKRRLKYLNVQAIAEPGDDQSVRYTIWCDGLSFSERLLGSKFHEQVARHLLQRRDSPDDYPVYITDLDLSAVALTMQTPPQTTHYLRHKQRLEAEINRAVARLAQRPGA